MPDRVQIDFEKIVATCKKYFSDPSPDSVLISRLEHIDKPYGHFAFLQKRKRHLKAMISESKQRHSFALNRAKKINIASGSPKELNHCLDIFLHDDLEALESMLKRVEKEIDAEMECCITINNQFDVCTGIPNGKENYLVAGVTSKGKPSLGDSLVILLSCTWWERKRDLINDFVFNRSTQTSSEFIQFLSECTGMNERWVSDKVKKLNLVNIFPKHQK